MKSHLLSRAILFAISFSALPVQAGWQEQIGFLRLQATFAGGIPTSVAAGVTHVEAGTSAYSPNFGLSYLSGKISTLKSGASGTSGHATNVAQNFYGNGSNSLIPGTINIDNYSGGGWMTSVLHSQDSTKIPEIETRSLENHSWHVTNPPSGFIEDVGSRMDYMIDRDGTVACASVGDAGMDPFPAQTFHVISVGQVDGGGAHGLTKYDTPGRMKPDMVSFAGATSWTSPQVASAAGVLSEKLRQTSFSPPFVPADYPRLTKALLLAGAAKEPLSSWSRASTAQPYDGVFGAGALNILLSYRILMEGRHPASNLVAVEETGWDNNAVSSGTPRTYFFDIPAGTVGPKFSVALTWHRVITSANIKSSTPGVLANLDIRLYSATGTTLGSQIDASVSVLDNVEHIYQPFLSPGRYALQVTSASATSTPYALAWRTSPTITVAATQPLGADGSPGAFTLTRTNGLDEPLVVPLVWGGSATAGTANSAADYLTPPATVLIPAGSLTATVPITPIGQRLAQNHKTVTLSVESDYSLSAGVAATDTLQVKLYDTWRLAHFTSSELNDPGISGSTADPDKDGLPNLLEYALGADPRLVDASAHAPVIGSSNGYPTLTYVRPTVWTDVNYVVEWSADLKTWSSGGSATTLVSTTDNGDGTTTVVVRSMSPINTAPRQFLRLRVDPL